MALVCLRTWGVSFFDWREGQRWLASALWVATRRSTDAYLHADLTIKERALARTTPITSKPGRYRPPDSLLAFLESL